MRKTGQVTFLLLSEEEDKRLLEIVNKMATELVGWMENQEKLMSRGTDDQEIIQPELFVLDKLPIKKHSKGPDFNRSAPMTSRGNMTFTFDTQFVNVEKKRNLCLISKYH